jgi:hypothetical protein
MDLEQMSKNITLDTTAMEDIATACNKLLDIQKEVSALEDQLKKKKEQELKLSEQDIPNNLPTVLQLRSNHIMVREYLRLERKKLLIGFVKIILRI